MSRPYIKLDELHVIEELDYTLTGIPRTAYWEARVTAHPFPRPAARISASAIGPTVREAIEALIRKLEEQGYDVRR